MFKTLFVQIWCSGTENVDLARPQLISYDSMEVFSSANGSSHLVEVWPSDTELAQHFRSTHYRNHMKEIVDCLLQPELTQRAILPSAWFS